MEKGGVFTLTPIRDWLSEHMAEATFRIRVVPPSAADRAADLAEDRAAELDAAIPNADRSSVCDCGEEEEILWVNFGGRGTRVESFSIFGIFL